MINVEIPYKQSRAMIILINRIFSIHIVKSKAQKQPYKGEIGEPGRQGHKVRTGIFSGYIVIKRL